MHSHFLSRTQMDRFILDDQTRFWQEIDELPELNPIRDYKVVIDVHYENKVSLDLDTRVKAILTLFESKRSDKFYILEMAINLRNKCIKADRTDLVDFLDVEVQKRLDKL